jgi:hypothetical protein
MPRRRWQTLPPRSATRVKEERKRSEEVAAVRAGLAKLQSIKV